jgi:predicted transcriptional regulator
MAHDNLVRVAEDLRAGKPVAPVTVRELLSWYGVQRRGLNIVFMIRDELAECGLLTDPDFNSVYIDYPIHFVLVAQLVENIAQPVGAKAAAIQADADFDATYRISRLRTSNAGVVSVALDTPVAEVVTLMLAHNYSQLPVMNGQREVKGVVSWPSLGARFALKKNGDRARDVMDAPVPEARFDAFLFDVIPTIIQHQYLLIRGADNRITGIVTATDLSEQFRSLTEPFLLLGEIENHIRMLIGTKLSVEELREVRDPADNQRAIDDVTDLSFGEYVRLLENEDRWKKIGIAIDRAKFCGQLEKVREIRNDVMHFDPDGIARDDLEALRNFVQFLQRLRQIGVT